MKSSMQNGTGNRYCPAQLRTSIEAGNLRGLLLTLLAQKVGSIHAVSPSQSRSLVDLAAMIVRFLSRVRTRFRRKERFVVYPILTSASLMLCVIADLEGPFRLALLNPCPVGWLGPAKFL